VSFDRELATKLLAIEQAVLENIDIVYDWNGHSLQKDRVENLKRVVAAAEEETA
jgi:hypothetical protein